MVFWFWVSSNDRIKMTKNAQERSDQTPHPLLLVVIKLKFFI